MFCIYRNFRLLSRITRVVLFARFIIEPLANPRISFTFREVIRFNVTESKSNLREFIRHEEFLLMIVD